MFSRHLIAAMEPPGFKIMYKFVALLFLFVSLSKGLDRCENDGTSHTLAQVSTCDPSGEDEPVPVTCPGDHEIPLPNIVPNCKPSDGHINHNHGVDCYQSENIAMRHPNNNNRDIQINNGADALVDGDPTTYVNVSNRNGLPSSWTIWLGRQFSVYAVYVVFLNPPQNLRVEVQTRHRIQGPPTMPSSIPCIPAGQVALVSSSERLRFVFYCLPNQTNDKRLTDDEKLYGRLTQNVIVTVNTRQVARLAEIQVYENQGLECGPPSQPWNTTYSPIEASYHVGDEVKYSCINSTFVMFGSDERHCGSDGRWVGFAPLCRQVSLLGHDSFVAESIHFPLLDQDKGTCSNIEKLVKNISTNQDVIEYKFRLKNRPGQTYPTVIGRIHIDILGTPNTCQIEIPSHPNIVFVLNNQTKIGLQGGITTSIFVPRIPNKNDDGSECLPEEINPGRMIQSFVVSNTTPVIALKCPITTKLCEIRVFAARVGTNRCGLPEHPLNSNYTINRAQLTSVTYKCDPGFRLVDSNGVGFCPNRRQWERPPLCQKIDCGLYPPEKRDSKGTALVWRLIHDSIDPGSIARYFYTDGSEPSPAVLVKCNDEGQWVDESEANSINLISIICASIAFIIVLIVVFFILRHRRNRMRNKRRSDELKGKSAEVSPIIRNHPYETRSGNNSATGTPRSLPHRPESTIYEEIENVYDYDDISKHQMESRRNDYEFRRQLESSLSLSPRPPHSLPININRSISHENASLDFKRHQFE